MVSAGDFKNGITLEMDGNIGVIPILMKMVLGILHLITTQFIVTGKAKF